MAKSVMIQGTASSVGKSILTAGLCRVLKQAGFKVAPFKSQNMALNSFITEKGDEMGRAQVVQAEAAGIVPDVLMNPILLKPSTDKKSQVILNGKVYKNMSAVEYHEFKPELKVMVKETYDKLASDYDYIVLEGAGSPAEINLREGDLVNMGMAELSDSPVILVGDIDRGGVFASLYGTILLLEEEERKRVKGVIINKFRGDVEILKPGLRMFEELAKVPVLGVLPYMDLKIEDEDSLAERFRRKSNNGAEVTVEVLYLPHVSNFTDFNIFETQEDVNLKYVMRGDSIGNPDILIIPGSKNTIEDMVYLHRTGLAEQILRAHRNGALVIGICGGYQMLGERISDPHGTESSVEAVNGLGLLGITTTFEPEKTTTQVKAKMASLPGRLEPLSHMPVSGYEIHMGQSELSGDSAHVLRINKELNVDVDRADGAVRSDGSVFGTYLHGIFDEVAFVRTLLNIIRREKGLDDMASSVDTFEAYKELEYEKLANQMKAHLDMDAIMDIIDGWHSC
ncbi:MULTISPECIES: cobyric acid synthase [unclassified Fusibacter]|uniref:cobyric acid synthase n=1 Tax=unclassified Fusibacter TaxID=2624464 RepID=UPI0010115715|nr:MULTISPECIES: cobyric acid synthase [unclassified Fusibacter]MCK8059761.1 cobyric acid synthase [Fusibacter sp. A2]NPE21562.1 cobyric acid synthase [Fusibacter sp. A1]RXV61970.1 cobyric acid synthase [Fusibacter sp. A1]